MKQTVEKLLQYFHTDDVLTGFFSQSQTASLTLSF